MGQKIDSLFSRCELDRAERGIRWETNFRISWSKVLRFVYELDAHLGPNSANQNDFHT